MDRELAETHLRLLAEAELRRVRKTPGGQHSRPVVFRQAHTGRAGADAPWAPSAPTSRLRSRPTSA